MKDEAGSADSALPKQGTIQRLRGGVQRRYSGSVAETFWTRLAATDFMSEAMLLSAIILLCFIPFTIVVAAFTGRSDVTGLARRLGLNHEAANDLSRVFGPAHSTTSSISGAGYVLFILGGIAFVSAVQSLYEKVFGLQALGMMRPPGSRSTRGHRRWPGWREQPFGLSSHRWCGWYAVGVTSLPLSQIFLPT